MWDFNEKSCKKDVLGHVQSLQRVKGPQRQFTLSKMLGFMILERNFSGAVDV